MRIRTIYVFVFSVICLAQTNVLEFRGMRPGMTKQMFVEMIGRIAETQGDKGKVECIPAGQNTLCSWGLYNGMLSGDQLVEIEYKVPLFERPISGFVKAFTQKYGKPTVKERSYTNGFGATFTGKAFVWHRGTQTLEVAEMCSAVSEPCITLLDPKLIKESTPPPI